MRTAFIETLCTLAEHDDRIWLLCGDLGYSVLERFADRFPKRYVNVGVAEQNMTGVAAGLALCGKIVFTYSIANFPVMRCLEQIRNDVCYHHLNVKIVAVGGGFAYGTHGYTHHGLEDLAVMRAMPNLAVLAPGDPVEVRQAIRAVVDWPGPCYLRVGKAGEPVLHLDAPAFRIGRAIRLREGRDVTLISAGGMLQTALQTADLLQTRGLQARVLSMHTLQPADAAAIQAAAEETKGVVTLEEHSLNGGLGSIVSEVLAAAPARGWFLRLGIASPASVGTGGQAYLRSRSGLLPDQIASAIVRRIADPEAQRIAYLSEHA